MTEPSIHAAQVIGRFGGGGAERVAWNLALALRDQDVRSTCIALRRSGTYANQATDITVMELAADNGLLSRLCGLWRLRRFICDERPNLIHVHGPQSLVFTAIAMRGLQQRPQLWFTWHDSGDVLGGNSLRHRLTRWAVRHCDRVFGSSNLVVSRLQAAAGLNGCVSVFRNGVPATPAMADLSTTTPTLLWLARIAPAKDTQILLHAAARLREEGLNFRIILAGNAVPRHEWYEDQTRQLVHDLDLQDIVEMPGWVDDVPALLERSAIGVQTSHTEGLSMTLLEQMMAGLAVVATDVGDTAVAIEHEKTGLLIPPKDEVALTDALRRVIADVDLCRRFGTAARQKAVVEFSLDTMAQRVLAYIAEDSKYRPSPVSVS